MAYLGLGGSDKLLYEYLRLEQNSLFEKFV